MCMGVLFARMSVTHRSVLPSKTRRECWISWDWSYGHLSHHVGAEYQTWSSGGAATI